MHRVRKSKIHKTMTIDESELPDYVEPYQDDDTLPLEGEQHRPVHESDITDSGVIAAVRRAYRDSKPNRDVDTDGSRRLNFWSDWYSVGDRDMTTAVGFIGQYNRFTPEEIQDMLHALPRDTYVSLSRESSVAMYFYTTEPLAVLLSLEGLDGRPDELTAYEGCETYPPKRTDCDVIYGFHDPDTDLVRLADGPVLIRAWWD